MNYQFSCYTRVYTLCFQFQWYCVARTKSTFSKPLSKFQTNLPWRHFKRMTLPLWLKCSKVMITWGLALQPQVWHQEGSVLLQSLGLEAADSCGREVRDNGPLLIWPVWELRKANYYFMLHSWTLLKMVWDIPLCHLNWILTCDVLVCTSQFNLVHQRQVCFCLKLPVVQIKDCHQRRIHTSCTSCWLNLTPLLHLSQFQLFLDVFSFTSTPLLVWEAQWLSAYSQHCPRFQSRLGRTSCTCCLKSVPLGGV